MRVMPPVARVGLALVVLASLAAAPAAGPTSALTDPPGAASTPALASQAAASRGAAVGATYYITASDATLRSSPNATAQVLTRPTFRDAVRVIGSEDGWKRVQYRGHEGYLPAEAVSNVWIRVSKTERTVYVYRGAELYRTLPADVSSSDEDKVRRGGLLETEHHRIPEGTFYVCRKNARSSYYRAFVLNYPNQVHALRGLRSGLITEAQYMAIAAAEEQFREPPMNTPLGGLIEIHGDGSGRRRAWTRGCVALRNVHMDELWDMVVEGTPVVIER